MNKIIIVFSTLFWTVLVFGQSKADKELSMFLKETKPNSYVYIRSGCKTCDMGYEDTIRNWVDTVTIKLLTKKQGKLMLAIFNDWNDMTQQEIHSTKIFEYINENMSVFKEKDAYYKELKRDIIQPPSMSVFPYETININLPNFKYSHTSVNREMSNRHGGVYLDREKWFQKEVELLKMIDEIIGERKGEFNQKNGKDE